MFERVTVVSALDRVLDELKNLEVEIAMTALVRPSDKTEFGYGHACGSVQTVRRCLLLIEHCLNEGQSERTRHEEN